MRSVAWTLVVLGLGAAAGLLEGGFRFEGPDGFVAGFDVPVLVTPKSGRSPFVGPLFSRAWLGWAFDL